MSASEKAVEILCSKCPDSQYLCGCRAASELRKTIAEAQLEAVEKAFSLRPLSLCVNYDESITAYMHKLKKAAGKGE